MKRKALVPSITVNEKGFVLVAALLFLVILSIIGIMASNTSVMEIQIAGNDRVHKQTFSQADGGTEIGSNLLEENIPCDNGFTGTVPIRIGAAGVNTRNFWINETEPAVPYDSDAQFHIRIPANAAVPPYTNLYFSGRSDYPPGNGMSQNSDPEDKKGILDTRIVSQHRGLNNSATTVWLRWRHFIGTGGSCKY